MAKAPEDTTKKTDEKKPFVAKDWRAENPVQAKAAAEPQRPSREAEIQKMQEEIDRLAKEGNQPARLEELRSLIDKKRAEPADAEVKK